MRKSHTGTVISDKNYQEKPYSHKKVLKEWKIEKKNLKELKDTQTSKCNLTKCCAKPEKHAYQKRASNKLAANIE